MILESLVVFAIGEGGEYFHVLVSSQHSTVLPAFINKGIPI